MNNIPEQHVNNPEIDEGKDWDREEERQEERANEDNGEQNQQIIKPTMKYPSQPSEIALVLIIVLVASSIGGYIAGRSSFDMPFGYKELISSGEKMSDFVLVKSDRLKIYEDAVQSRDALADFTKKLCPESGNIIVYQNHTWKCQ